RSARQPLHPTFPYTTLFRSARRHERAHQARLDRRLAARRRTESLKHGGLRAPPKPPNERADGKAAVALEWPSCAQSRDPRNRSRDRKSTRLNSSHLGISYAV